MKIIGLDGKIYKWTLKSNPRSDFSQYHEKARFLLKKILPLDTILEEVSLPGSDLTVDFFLPIRKLGIEVQGEQHYKFVKHFHNNVFGFNRSIQRDRDKKLWFESNNFNFIELSYKETENEWRDNIITAISKRTDGST